MVKDLACVAFTGVDAGSMGLVSDPDDEEWGFTNGVDGKNSILAAASTCSSSDKVLVVDRFGMRETKSTI
nr:hypothetical protein CFP56_46102 [Quercus suber]